MSGNVSEWVGDVYRPMTSLMHRISILFRGNKFPKFYKNSRANMKEIRMGHLKKEVFLMKNQLNAVTIKK